MFGIHPTHSANARVEVGEELTRRFRQIDGNEETFAHKLITGRLPQGKMFGYDGEPLALLFPLERKRRRASKYHQVGRSSLLRIVARSARRVSHVGFSRRTCDPARN